MISKTLNYVKAYDEWSDSANKVEELRFEITTARETINKLQTEQSETDPSDDRVIGDRMSRIAKERIEQIDKEIENEATLVLGALADKGEEFLDPLKASFENWGGARSLQQLPAADVNVPIEFHESKAFPFFRTFNSFCAYVFRLQFLEKVVSSRSIRVIIGAIIWFVLMFQLLSFVLMESTFVNHYLEQKVSVGIEQIERDQTLDDDQKKAAGDRLLNILVIEGVAVCFVLFFSPELISLIAFAGAKISFRKQVKKNSMLYLAAIDKPCFTEKLYEAKRSKLAGGEVKNLEAELERFTSGTMTDEERGTPGSLYAMARESVQVEYDRLAERIVESERMVEKLEEQVAEAIKVAKDQGDHLSELEEVCNGWVIKPSDPACNDGALTPYLPLQFHEEGEGEPKSLSYIKHDYRPVCFAYEGKDKLRGEELRDLVARLSTSVFEGFLHENWYEAISLYFIDFHSGGALLEKSIVEEYEVNVISNQSDLDKLYGQLEKAREAARTQGNSLEEINPKRVARDENPLKYTIAVFFSVDFTSLPQQHNQLFVGGESFGFIPIILLSDDDIDELERRGSSSSSSVPFASVIREMQDNESVYGIR